MIKGRERGIRVSRTCKRCGRKIEKYIVNWYHVDDNGQPFIRDDKCKGVELQDGQSD